jgi:hypothetical protein
MSDNFSNCPEGKTPGLLWTEKIVPVEINNGPDGG